MDKEQNVEPLTDSFTPPETSVPPIIARGIQQEATARALTNPDFDSRPFRDLRDDEIDVKNAQTGERHRF